MPTSTGRDSPARPNDNTRVDRSASWLELPFAGESVARQGCRWSRRLRSRSRTWTGTCPATCCGGARRAATHGSDYEVDGGSASERYTGSVSVDTVTWSSAPRRVPILRCGYRRRTVRGACADVTLVAGLTTYDLDISLQTWRDGEPFAARHWHRRVPRDLADGFVVTPARRGSDDRPVELVGLASTLVPVGPGEHVVDLRRILATPEVSARWGDEAVSGDWPQDDLSAVRFAILVDGAVCEAWCSTARRTTRCTATRPSTCSSTRGARSRRRRTRRRRNPRLHLVDDCGHHRIVIDPAADNEPAIRCYAAVGFRPGRRDAALRARPGHRRVARRSADGPAGRRLACTLTGHCIPFGWN